MSKKETNIITEFDKEVYISCDVEADGPYPGDYSMLNFGCASFKLIRKNPLEPLDTFSINLYPLLNAKQHPKTMKFWDDNIEVYRYITQNQIEPNKAMDLFRNWINKQSGTPALVEYPGGWDFMYIYWYLMKFGGYSPFSFKSIGIATLAFAMLKDKRYRRTVKRNMPKHWFKNTKKHTHQGLDDAIGQGQQFMIMLIDNLKLEDKELLKQSCGWDK